MSKIKAEVYSIIKKTLHVNPEKMPDTTPWYDLGAESFDLIELVIALREHFNLKITTQDLSKIVTLKELLAFIEKQAKG